MSNIKLVYITCRNDKEATQIANKLINNKLIACANIISKAISIFKWNKKLNKTKESILLAKTNSKKVKKIMSLVLKNHSYTNPCILFFNIEQSTQLFSRWVNNCLK